MGEIVSGKAGKIYRITGPVVVAKGLSTKMYDVVRVGNENIMGEVIQIIEEHTVIQVYEDTSGIKPGEPVVNTGQPLLVELGPGLLASIYDGIQRPLPVLKEKMGDFIKRGVDAPGLDRKKKWEFRPTASKGQFVQQGDLLGEVEEMGIKHKILVPYGMSGKILEISKGKFSVEETICKLDNGVKLTLMQKWPVRVPRPSAKKLSPNTPLLTGQRIFDALFPIARGGVAAIPGPFGAGKSVTQQQLAKWADADIIVYIGCGERGNEMTEVLTEFPHLTDPKSGNPLMNRTVLIANTSNMPVAAREASIYSGITIAEYYRDMGYSVALMADSTSRWAEAMREISSRLEEMPGEEGYPAYLSTRLAEFYERAGRVIPLGAESGNKEHRETEQKKERGRVEGSVSVIGAISPPGGDFSEPVTQGTLRVTKVFWALDAKLAQRRHFPSINWLTSYSLYHSILAPWFSTNVAADWRESIGNIMRIMQEEEKLLEIVQLVGSDALPDREQLTLDVAKMIREFFLQQNAYHEIDTYCELKKTYMLMKIILNYSHLANETLSRGVNVRDILAIKSKHKIANIRFEKDYENIIQEIEKEMKKEFELLKVSY